MVGLTIENVKFTVHVVNALVVFPTLSVAAIVNVTSVDPLLTMPRFFKYGMRLVVLTLVPPLVKKDTTVPA
jgi:hypothetical protein